MIYNTQAGISFFQGHFTQGTWLLMDRYQLLQGSILLSFSIHQNSFHSMSPTFSSGSTKQQHVSCFFLKCLPQICKQHRHNTQPTSLDTAPCWLACRHFLATKCQRKRNAVVYEHLDEEQRKKKIYIWLGERKKKKEKKTLI